MRQGKVLEATTLPASALTRVVRQAMKRQEIGSGRALGAQKVLLRSRALSELCMTADVFRATE